MGVSSSKTEEKALKKIINKSQKECYQIRLDGRSYIRKNKNKVTQYLKQNDVNSAKRLMKIIIREENDFQIYGLLDSNLQKIKENCSSIESSKRCPVKLKSPLNTILFAANKLNNRELIKFSDKIIELYGSEYVTQAINNTDKSVNEDLIKKLETEISEELIKTR